MTQVAGIGRYREVYALVRRRTSAADGRWARLGQGALFAAVTIALVPLVRSVFFWFLDAPPQTWPEGLAGAWGRAGLLLLAVVGLGVHGTVLRGPARRVLSLHPVDPAAVVQVELESAARAQLPILLALAVLTAPVAQRVGLAAWGLGLAVMAGATALALVASAMALLGSIDVAEDPRWAPLLDSLRGNNPRPQAALIYALAPSTLVGGWLVMVSAQAAVSVWQGSLGSLPWLVAPWAVAGVGLAALPRVARRTWFPASAVLADIRARYDAVEHPDEARRVFMDWTLRWLPDDVSRWALLLLRYGWRERRGVLSALWLVALAALVAGWTEDPSGAAQAGLIGGVAGWWAGVLAVLAARDEPPFLATWLPRSSMVTGLAAAWCVAVWASGPVLVGVVSVGVRQGMGAGATALGVAVAHVLAAGLCAGLASGWRGRGLAPYVAVAVLASALTATALFGGGA